MVRLKLTKGSVSSSVIWKIFLFGYFPRAILLVANFEGNPLHHSVEYYTYKISWWQGGSWRRMPRGQSTGLGLNAETCEVPSGCDWLAKQEIPTVFKSRSSRP